MQQIFLRDKLQEKLLRVTAALHTNGSTLLKRNKILSLIFKFIKSLYLLKISWKNVQTKLNETKCSDVSGLLSLPQWIAYNRITYIDNFFTIFGQCINVLNYNGGSRQFTEPRGGEVNIHHWPPTLRWIVVLFYTKTVR